MWRTGEHGVPGTVAGELGAGSASTSEGGVGVSEWFFAPAKWRNKLKSVMKDTGDSKAGQLEDAATSIDTSDCDYMANCSEVSNTMSDSQEKEFYILYKCFLQQTKAMKDLDLEKYFLFYLICKPFDQTEWH